MPSIALVQIDSVPEQPRENLQKIVAYSKKAAGQGADIIVFHEATLTDYVSDPAKFAEMVPDGPACTVIRELARELGVYISFGLLEQQEGKFFISQVFFGPQNFYYRYRKTNLHQPEDKERAAKRHRDEASYLTPGSGPEVFLIDGLRASCIICADGNSPDVLYQVRTLRPDIVFFPNNRVRWRPDEYWANIAQTVNAPLLITNRVGESWGFSSLGGSSVFSANSKCLARANMAGKEEILLIKTEELLIPEAGKK